jgi:predicted dehydrogenase
MITKIHPWRNPLTEARVAVTQWLVRDEIRDQYIEYPQSVWLVWNYLLRFGVRAVLGKVRSRLSERERNHKTVGVGIGDVCEAPENYDHLLGRSVLFVAPNHPAGHELAVVPVCLLTPIHSERSVNQASVASLMPLEDLCRHLRAWSPYSGTPIDDRRVSAVLADMASTLSVEGTQDCPKSHVPVLTRLTGTNQRQRGALPTAVLFGLGNYAKTAILPNIRRHLELQRVHELDTAQLRFLGSNPSLDVDTCPLPRNDRKFDAWLIAGYHHTHAELAASAIRAGAVAVIEKPLATTRGQFESFLTALRANSSGRFYACFHKRYSIFAGYVLSDLGCVSGAPVDMHCVVYEIPLPTHHWYNWPNSGSRLISNGCHWIDYFMYVNGYPRVEFVGKWQPRGKDVVAQVRLENGAYLSMSVTDAGSQRLGMRDHVELRHGGTTVTITDSSSYVAENRRRVMRRARCNSLSAYARMYREIAKSIATGEPGDTLDSLRSTEATLQLEEL